MSMKKILMAAVAVTALTAGSASAITISKTASTMGTGSITLTPTTVTGGPTTEPYTIASEVAAPTTAVVSSIVATLTDVLTSGTSYVVTYTVTNGTFGNSASELGVIASGNITALDNAGTPAAVALAPALGTITSTQAQFVITPAAANAKTLTWATKGIKPLSTKLPVSITVSIAASSSPTINIDGGVSPSVTVIDFREGVSFKATKAPQKLSIASGFKKFVPASGTTDAAYADLATSMGTVIAGPAVTGVTTDIIYKNGTGGALATTDVATAVLTFSGDFTKLDGRLGSAQLADTGTTNVFTADATNLSNFQGGSATFGLVGKATALVGAEGSYAVTPVVTLTTGLNAPTLPTTTLGAVTFEGTSLFAPWVSDGTNGTNNVIRIGNKSDTAAVTSVKASLLNPTVKGTSGTVASTTTCELGTIAVAGELVINSAALKTCFGSFARSDVRLTVQGAADNLTLKMRSSTNGVTTENLVGSGVTALTGNN